MGKDDPVMKGVTGLGWAEPAGLEARGTESTEMPAATAAQNYSGVLREGSSTNLV